MNYKQAGASKLVTLTILLAVCGILVIGVLLMPKGFKDDLSVIGQGSVSVVLVHDKNLVAGTETMALLNKIRSDYEGVVDFLAVDIDTPVGQVFVQEQRVNVIDLVIFGQDGSRKKVIGAGISERALRSVLSEMVSP